MLIQVGVAGIPLGIYAVLPRIPRWVAPGPEPVARVADDTLTIRAPLDASNKRFQVLVAWGLLRLVYVLLEIHHQHEVTRSPNASHGLYEVGSLSVTTASD